MTQPTDPRTGRPIGDHGTALQAIEWILQHADFDSRCQPDEFLKAWREGDLDEWPEFYTWLAKQPSHDPWSTDLDAAPEEKDVLVYCADTNAYHVAYRPAGKLRGWFCYAIHRGAFIMCQPTKWREISE